MMKKICCWFEEEYIEIFDVFLLEIGVIVEIKGYEDGFVIVI